MVDVTGNHPKSPVLETTKPSRATSFVTRLGFAGEWEVPSDPGDDFRSGKRVEGLFDFDHFPVLLAHLVENDGVPRRLTPVAWHVVLASPAPQTKFLDQIQLSRYATDHDS